MSLGVHFALTPEQRANLLAQPDDDARVRYMLESIEGAWDKENLQETDKAWIPIALSLAEHPVLHQMILGGRSLSEGDQFILRLIEPDAVAAIAEALAEADDEWMTKAYHERCSDEPEYGDEELEYMLHWFGRLREFFVRIAPTGRAVLFSADQ